VISSGHFFLGETKLNDFRNFVAFVLGVVVSSSSRRRGGEGRRSSSSASADATARRRLNHFSRVLVHVVMSHFSFFFSPRDERYNFTCVYDNKNTTTQLIIRANSGLKRDNTTRPFSLSR